MADQSDDAKKKQQEIDRRWDEFMSREFTDEELDELIKNNRYVDRWDESRWQEEMTEHPLFVKQEDMDKGDLPPLIEAIRQLKYDPNENSARELANNYREDGNENFRLKKYRWAIDSYTAGLKALSTAVDDEDLKLRSTLFSNRGAAHFRIKNFRTSLNDSLKALMFCSTNSKATLRVAQSYAALGRYDDLLRFAQKHRDSFTEEMDKFIADSRIKLKERERDRRREEAKQREVDELRNSLEQSVSRCGIKWVGSLFDPVHPAAQGQHVRYDTSDSSKRDKLNWPVLFLYPENGQSDFVESFPDDCLMMTMLENLLAEPPAWDSSRKYTAASVIVQSSKSGPDGGFLPVDKNKSLKDILAHPDAACIKPPGEEQVPQNESVKSVASRGRVQVSLTDCLACSGCVTSAETVLIEQQSHAQVYKVLEANAHHGPESAEYRHFVVSMSHQAITSFASKYKLGLQDAAEKLSCFFATQLGARLVCDLTMARHISLAESRKEFIQHLADSTRKANALFSSVCPGWVCYVEKTHGDLLVPHLSRVKSPQQIAGSIFKMYSSKMMNMAPHEMYHISLMPCFDKKLEASRKEFTRRILSADGSTVEVKDVDCVLTPIELELMLERENVDLTQLHNRKLDLLHRSWPTHDGLLESHFGSGSGGYTENIVRSLLPHQDDTHKLEYKVERNRDFMTITIPTINSAAGDEQPIVCGVVNGFRNIQTLVQRMKRKGLALNYVEVMACPKGCLNGGAQLRHDKSNAAVSKDPLENLEKLYASLPRTNVSFDTEKEPMRSIYQDLSPSPEVRRQMFYTAFHAVPKTVNLLTANW